MSGKQLEKIYEPKQVEDRWYRHWVEKGYFHAPLAHPGEPYTIVIPPPNVTGSLHIGHALNNTLQDILIRWRRMQGRNALWVPGMDHAGIATQNVVERQLSTEGSSREQLGREKFIERVWAWKGQSGGTIIQQLKRLGASCDWSRERFTMDEGLSKAVREVFVRLHEDGLIYRGERLINWCPRCLTALSDIEVEHEDTKGKMYHISYPLADDPNTALTVATTRPETMLGDTAVAVHPEDPRYRHLIGKKVRLPLTTREIPIVGDSILVDLEFGTGAVKITPAHDFNDFEAGERHKLPRLTIFNHLAQLDPKGLKAAEVEETVTSEIQNLPVSKARSKVEQALKARDLLVKTEDHKMALGKCYRCKTVVEPYLSPQWFVKIKPLAEPAIKAVEDGRIRIVPESWTNNYLGWMRDIKDWCISRQIWWGHRIPAWYCTSCNRAAMVEAASSTSSQRAYTFLATAQPMVGRTAPAQCPACQQKDFIQDPDVLDTWFSSALWPFSTLGWPEQTPDLKKFYPTSTLVTGLDILFFWVARMIMMGLKFMGDVPFRDVYIHALVRDAEGQKMSKSKGNVVDPLHVMEQYGTDALRFTLAAMASPGRDIKLAEERIEGYRNFANKIWNAARFILMNLDGPREAVSPKDRPFADRWILSRLNRTIREVTASLEQYRFDQASSHLYQFIWHEYCDWYLELIKPALQNKDSVEATRTRQTLVETFETVQRLLHPFMPFISEEIWQTLPHEGESIVTQRYPAPTPDWDSKETETEFATVERFVSTARTGRSLLNVLPGKALTLFGTARDPEQWTTLVNRQSYAAHLSKGTITADKAPDKWGARVLRLPAEGLIVGIQVEQDVDLRDALVRISKQKQELSKECERMEAKLSNREFMAKAPEDVVAEWRQRIVTLKRESDLLADSERQLQEMTA
ncbi:MAG: valine--tRNA ligase [Nitrospiraceae bacterium]|nr:valine--tRNA ligase [Nitrospiraceae bacterium]MSR23514.1 valine--tRNA ligase [Nitrospiraceae bacterium]